MKIELFTEEDFPIWIGYRKTSHYASYVLFKGSCKNGRSIHIHHLCENPSCVNPQHLELTSAKRNILISSIQAKRLNCPKGHAYDMVERRRDGTFRSRRCRICKYESNTRWRARQHEQISNNHEHLRN